ncbi:MAG TPA: S8 family serine peptidase [Terriglobia bacterium]|nr:S8 family serine peptidase [Terriglobia bacterium]
MEPAKLTTVLEDLSRSVPQDMGPEPLASARPAVEFNSTAMPKSVRDAIQVRTLRVNPNGEVQVYILMSAVSNENLSQLKANGVTVEIPDAAGSRVQARIPVTRLQAVGALPFVNFVRLPTYAVHMTGSVDTEGDAILQADQARSQFHVDGSNVLVGVISDGIKGIFPTCPTPGTPCTLSNVTTGPIGTGDLPSATGARNASGVLTTSTGGIKGQSFQANGDLEGIPRDSNGNPTPCGFAGAGAEGTALLEIIHDIAPGAQLAFANASTDIEFNQAVNGLAAANDVVMDDLGFFGEPMDGTSSVSTNTANALNSSSFPIRGYVTAVGNASDSHYLAPYADSHINGSSITGKNGDLHLFQASSDTTDTLGLGSQTYDEIKLQGTTSSGNPTNGGEVVVVLTWDDPFGSSTNNFGLYLVQHGTTTVVQSDSGKTCEGSTFPVSCLSFVNNLPADTYYDIVIQNTSNASAVKNLNLYAFTPECAFGSLISLGPSRAKLNFNTSSRSVIAESDAGGTPVSVISAGAICSASSAAQLASSKGVFPDPSCLDTSHSTSEYFSSQGPTLDGRNKPDISGIDGVSITGAGGFENPFFGTSAAAPHIAGIAALLLESKSCLLSSANSGEDNVTARTDLRNLLLNNAIPLGGPSPNNIFGAGRADALGSVNATIPAFSGSSSLVVGGNTPTGVSLTAPQLGFAVPTTCPLATLNFSGDCGTGTGTSMNCAFGTKNVNVMASNVLSSAPTLTYSPPANIQIVVSNFTFGVAPGSATVSAGQSATYTATASAQGGAFPSAITLACSSLPTGAACSFNPPKIIPGATSAQSVLTISTTSRALSPPANWFPNVWDIWPAVLTGPWLNITLLVLVSLAAMIAATRLVGIRFAPGTFNRRWIAIGALSLVLVFISIQIACGGGGSSQSSAPSGTPAGSYSISISGSSGTLVQSGTATLVVQ